MTSLHVRGLWGGISVDEAFSQTPSYLKPTDYATLGESAMPGSGIGVRRATLVFDRLSAVPADDAMVMHFDFLNYTSGNPDDTWVDADYTTLEGLLNTWWNSTRTLAAPWARFSRVAWHRVGSGIVPPNPATRILDIVTQQVGSGSVVFPPQCACSITFRTGLRKHWGRSYFPAQAAVTTQGRYGGTIMGTLTTATQTLFQAARAADFLPVVLSKTLESALGIETIEVDDVVDIVRRRRWKHTGTRTIVPA